MRIIPAFSPRGDNHNAGFVRQSILTVIELLHHVPDEDTSLPLERLQDIVDAYNELDDLQRNLPKVEGWCVVKKYHGYGWEGKEAIWCACTIQEQANDLALFLYNHYKAKHPGGITDDFVVEYRPAKINEFLKPDVTPEEYKRNLG